MTPYSFPGASFLDQRRYYRKIIRDHEADYLKKFKRITKAIEMATGVNMELIRSKKRKTPLPFLRALIAEELYNPKFISFSRIGNDLDRDHTTIMYYIHELLPSLMSIEKYKLLKQNIKKYF